MIVLKFGGECLVGDNLTKALSIIQMHQEKQNLGAVVVSARGQTTNLLIELIESARKGCVDHNLLGEVKDEQTIDIEVDLTAEFKKLDELLEGISLLRDCSNKTRDEVLALGELMSAKCITASLTAMGVVSTALDARQMIITDEKFSEAQPDIELSEPKVREALENVSSGTVPIITGFIAAAQSGETTTLGRNGGNYTAALIANFIDAQEVHNYTYTHGIYTANPHWVSDAQLIPELSFDEANDLANLGATILHGKTILPLESKNIPLKIYNIHAPETQGTLIHGASSERGIKAIGALDEVALIQFEGRGLLGKIGIDARIFQTLSNHHISVSFVAQSATEQGVALVVPDAQADLAVSVLRQEFAQDIAESSVNSISARNDVAIVSIVGQELREFRYPLSALVKNQVVPLLFNTSISSKNIALVIEKNDLKKAVNVIHGQVFGAVKRVNLLLFGKGLVGGALIKQILTSSEQIEKRRQLQLRIVGIMDSSKCLLKADGIQGDWLEQFQRDAVSYNDVSELTEFTTSHHLENVIAIDNTASSELADEYINLVRAGCDLVSSNKLANTLSFESYQKLREALEKYNKTYLYETNVGAGLPLIDTIHLLHESGENITRIRGVFSGSLSFLFNDFSAGDVAFSEVLQSAMDKGYTEPDPREDLCGNDVARKLLVLARELDLANEFEDIVIENLIPEQLRPLEKPEFLENIHQFDKTYADRKKAMKPDHVLRYVADLSGDLQQSKGELSVQLVEVPSQSPLGALTGSDTLFEIFTESYGENPIVIQGAGAGAEVTARGVFGDILRIAKREHS